MDNLTPDIMQLLGGQQPQGWQSVGQAINEPTDIEKLMALLSVASGDLGQTQRTDPSILAQGAPLPLRVTSAPNPQAATALQSPIAPQGEPQGGPGSNDLAAIFGGAGGPSSRQTVATPADAVGELKGKSHGGLLGKKGIGGGTIGQNILVGLLSGLAAATRQPEHIAASYQAGIDLGRKRKEEDEQSKRIAEMFTPQLKLAEGAVTAQAEQTKGVIADTALRSWDLSKSQQMLPEQLKSQLINNQINQSQYDITMATKNDVEQGSHLNLKKLVMDVDNMPAEYKAKLLALTQNNKLVAEQIEGAGIENGLRGIQLKIQSDPKVLAATISQIVNNPTGKENQDFQVRMANSNFEHAKVIDEAQRAGAFANETKMREMVHRFDVQDAEKKYSHEDRSIFLRSLYIGKKIPDLKSAQSALRGKYADVQRMKFDSTPTPNRELKKLIDKGDPTAIKTWENFKAYDDSLTNQIIGLSSGNVPLGAEGSIDGSMGGMVESSGLASTQGASATASTDSLTKTSIGLMPEFSVSGVIAGKQMSWSDYEKNYLRPSFQRFRIRSN